MLRCPPSASMSACSIAIGAPFAPLNVCDTYHMLDVTCTKGKWDPLHEQISSKKTLTEAKTLPPATITHSAHTSDTSVTRENTMGITTSRHKCRGRTARPSPYTFIQRISRASACGASRGADWRRPHRGAPPCSFRRPRSCPRTSTTCRGVPRSLPTRGCGWRRGPGTNGRG